MPRQKLQHVLHDSAEIAFSGHQNAENELIQRYVPFNRWFHVSEKSHFQVSKMKKIYSNSNSGLHDSAKIAISWAHFAKNELI